MRSRRRWTLWTIGLLVAGCGGPRLAIDPIPVQDDDRYDIPQPPTRLRDDYYDLLDYTLFKQAEQMADLPRNARKIAGNPKQAMNATPLDEVQDSSWFTNRLGARRLLPEEVGRGPCRPQGPDLEHPWTIVAGKTQGITPGFTIEDGRGDRFVIKFDPRDFPELATGAEAISTRLFWAMGYNTPENYLVHFRPEQLRIASKASVKLELNKKRPMTQDDLDVILSKVPIRSDGTIRCIASRYLSGKPLGPIPFIGLRPGDPNDVIRHEHRRELRGYKVFASWLAHNDCREINSLDMFVEEEGRHFVKHYLIDFGATLGSASTSANLPSEGSQYQLDFGTMVKNYASLGLAEPEWQGVRYPALAGIGPFEAQHFEPERWKQNYPLPPFENTTGRDAFWAAKIVARFDDALLRAAVDAAQFSDPAASDYMVRTLAERRDRVARYGFSLVNPLDGFAVALDPSKVGGAPGAPVLRFDDLAVLYGYAPARHYQVRVTGPGGKNVAAYETEARGVGLAEALRTIGSDGAAATKNVAPSPAAQDRIVTVQIRSALPDGKWTKPVRVSVYSPPSGPLRVAAIERDE